jgi:hypothetical protein
MSIPVNLLKYAGVWDATRRYYEYDCTISPLTTGYFCCVVDSVIGAPDPSVQPSAVWIPFPAPVVPVPTFPPTLGSFSSTQNQPIPVGGGEVVLSYDTKDCPELNLGAIGAVPFSDIPIAFKGTYKVLSSVQFDKTGAGISPVDMYIKINNNPVPNTATKLNINLNEEDIMTVEWFVVLDVGDTVSVAIYSTNDTILAVSFPATPPVPEIPSVITTILRIA